MSAARPGSGPRAILIGTAAGGGVPQWNCRCRICDLAWRGDSRVRPRTQSSLAATGDGESWTLFNASPDLGAQIRATPALWPRRDGRHSPIGAVVLTNADIDHVGGLLTLRERHGFRLFALEPVHAAVAANPIFQALDRDLVERAAVEAGRAFAPTPGLLVRLLPAPGKPPLYLEGSDPAIGDESGETAGALISTATTRLAYVPGCAAISASLRTEIAAADVVLFDGTFYTDDEMLAAGLGAKTARRMGHVPIAGPGGSMEAIGSLKMRRFYTHLNNTNPALLAGSSEEAAIKAAGWEIAHDGMEVAL